MRAKDRDRLNPVIFKLGCIREGLNRRARRQGQPGYITVHDLLRLIKEQGYTCYYCKQEVALYEGHQGRDALTFDHKLSMGLGGTNTPDNLVICCRECNGERNDRDQRRAVKARCGVEP